MQRMHRHVESITTLILKHQKFAFLIAHLHALQTDVASDAIFFVHHGSASG